MLGTVSLAMAEDQLVVTKVFGRLPHLKADGKITVLHPASDYRIVKGKDWDLIGQEAESLIALMGQDQIWTDFGPDSDYVSVAITLNGKIYTINSWYPLYKDKDTIAYVDGSLVVVSSKKEKEERENTNDEKHKTLMKFLDKIIVISSFTLEDQVSAK